jgi:hypothetical protein
MKEKNQPIEIPGFGYNNCSYNLLVESEKEESKNINS